MDFVKVVEIGGEGGSIILFARRRGEEAWAFNLVTDESSLEEMLGESLSGHSAKQGAARTWRGALRLLSRYPWKMLYPLYVPPEFKALVLKEIKRARLEPYERAPWPALCSEIASQADHPFSFRRESGPVPSEKEIYERKAALLKQALAGATSWMRRT